jgi:hypothetical protein
MKMIIRSIAAVVLVKNVLAIHVVVVLSSSILDSRIRHIFESTTKTIQTFHIFN